MIFRNDDLSFGIDVDKYKKVQEVFEEFGIKEMYSVIPCGKNIYVPNTHMLSKEKEDELTGFNYVSDDGDVSTFIRDSIKRGHSISLHGWRHINIANYGYDEQYDKIKRAKGFLEDIYGQKIEYFIPPYNSYNKYTVLICKRLGMKILDYGGNQLEKLVEKNKLPIKTDYNWYHAWRFFEGNLTIDKLRLWLKDQQSA